MHHLIRLSASRNSGRNQSKPMPHARKTWGVPMETEELTLIPDYFLFSISVLLVLMGNPRPEIRYHRI
jgi:hypothetical protein